MITDGWKKSSYSNGEGGNCVEARGTGDIAGLRVQMRDTQYPGSGHLEVSSEEWMKLLAAASHT